MAIPKKLIAYLQKNKIRFESVPHKTVYTAYDLAQTAGEKLEKITKTLLVKIELPKVNKTGPNYYLVAVPASYRIDLKAVNKFLKIAKSQLTGEKEMKKLGMLPGAGTPFVGFYGNVGLILDKALVKAGKALVRAESFTDSLRVNIKDLIKAESALVAKIGIKVKMPTAPKSKKVPKKIKKKFATKAAYLKFLKAKKRK
jgi:hypothetical protein